MNELKQFDTVEFEMNGKTCYGEIKSIKKKLAKVFVFGSPEVLTLRLSDLVYVPPVKLTEEQVARFCRYEVTLSELTKGCKDREDIVFDGHYTITFEDILTAMKNIRASGDDNETVYYEWFSPLCDVLMCDDHICYESDPDGVENLEGLPDRTEILSDIFGYTLVDILCDSEEPIAEAAEQIIKTLETAIENEKLPVEERVYTDEQKEHYLRVLDNDDRLKTATDREIRLMRRFTDELCEKDSKTALRCKGYGCYGGNPAYECDWNTSFECISRLYELTGEAVYANTLGYIYYYGRCWDGQPKYDEAFKYFSIGAAGFYYESRYKLADMFAHGYAVAKNTEIAYSIVSELYDQNIKYILKGQFDCKFADIVLRLGSYVENGYGGWTSINSAYRYYLQADFAIRQRLKYGHYGDLSVADSIRQRLNAVLDSGKIEKPVQTAEIRLEELLQDHLMQYRRLQVRIKAPENGKMMLSISVEPFKIMEYPLKLFITSTDTGFCGMLGSLDITVKNAKILFAAKDTAENGAALFDDVDSCYTNNSKGVYVGRIEFKLGDKTQLVLRGNCFFTSPVKRSGKKHRIASVYFTPGGRYYDYLADREDISEGDKVCVMTDQGKTEVTVAAVSEKYESELALPIGKYKRILKKSQ